MKPSSVYFDAKGAGKTTFDLRRHRLDVISREIERLILRHIESGLDAEKRLFHPRMLRDATYDQSLLKALQESPEFPSLARFDMDIALAGIRDRAEALHIADLEHSNRHKARRKGALAIAGLLVAGIISTQLFQPGAHHSGDTALSHRTAPVPIQEVPSNDSTDAALPSPESPADTQLPEPPPLPKGLHIYGDVNAPGRIHAWLSFNCPNCADVWDNLRDHMAEAIDPDQAVVRVHVVPPKYAPFLTLSYYYEGILEQNPELATEFVSWVYENQARLADEGIQDGDFNWIKDRIDFQRFEKAISSEVIRDRMEATTAHAENLPGTPVLNVNGEVLAGSEITPNNISTLLEIQPAGGEDG